MEAITGVETDGSGPRTLSADPVRRDRSDGIDALRAVFALWVVLAHLIPWVPVAQGPGSVPGFLTHADRLLLWVFQPSLELHPAVLGFIVLSGYCIHRAGLRMPRRGDLRAYAIRRFFRIAPVYYLAIGAGLAGIMLSNRVSPSLTVILGSPGTIGGACLAAKALVVPAFDPAWYECTFLGNAPLVTVLVEIVLYVLYGAAFAGLVWRHHEWLIWAACGSLFIASVGAFALGVDAGSYRWWQNGSVFGFLPYWWLGVAFVNPGFAHSCTRRLWLILIVWAALTALLMAPHLPATPAIAELRKLFFALAIGIAIYRIDNIRAQGIRALALLGRAGYGLYAIHAPLTYTLAIYGVRWWLVLAANITAGLLLHYAVERPLIDVGRWLRVRLIPPAATAPAEAAD